MKKEEQENELALFRNEVAVASKSQKDLRKTRSYMLSPFIVAALPLRSVKETTFTRKYNNISMTLSSAKKLPYGKYGRLLLSILTTHAVLNSGKGGAVEVHYDKLNQLLNEMDLPSSRCNEVKEQLESFSKTSFLFEERKETVAQKELFADLFDNGDSSGTVKVTKFSSGNIRFMAGFQYLEVEDNNGNKKNTAFRMILSDEFVNFSKDHSVPIDYTTYKGIRSDVGKDLYAWLVYRNHDLKGEVFIPRHALINQFMPVTDDEKKDNERANYAYIIDQLKLIKSQYYKELKLDISEDGSGITLYKSPTPISSDDKRYVLITSDL